MASRSRPPPATPLTPPPAALAQDDWGGPWRLAEQAVGLGLFTWELSADRMVWSAGLCALVGRGEADAWCPQADWFAVMLEEDHALHAAALDAVRAGAPQYRCRLRVRRPDGTIRHLQATAEVARGADGQPLCLHGVVQDLGALVSLRASDEMLAAFPGYVAVVDAQHVYQYVNQQLAGLVGRPVEAFIGRTVAEVFGPERAAEVISQIARSANGERVVIERSYAANAERPRVDMQVTYVMHPRDGSGQPHFYAFGLDITHRKQAENMHVQARAEAERSSQAKSAFLANVSHELRTPLNAILGFSQVLRDGSQLPLETTDQAVAEIQRAGQHLLTLVDDLIDMGQVEAGRLELRMARVAVEAIVNESLSMVAPLAAQRGIRIVFTGGPARNAMVHADARRLRQVLINLLSNAIKYNQDEGSVRVHCGWRAEPTEGQEQPEATDPGGAVVRISVQDTGVGISEAMAQRMFSAFDRLGAERGATPGTGIGLVIAQRLVQAMGGSVGYLSQPERGSHFWVDLPQARPLPAAMPRAPARPGPGKALRVHEKPPRVLVAEDYAPNQAVMRLQLRSLGCEVDIAGDGVQALARWQDKSKVVDLILTDLDMPRMDGVELARAVRQAEGASRKRVPIIGISAAVVGDERARCLAAGISALLVKPVSIEDLAAALSHWLHAEDQGPVEGVGPAVESLAPEPAVPAGTLVPDPVLDLRHLHEVLGHTRTAQALGVVAAFVVAARAGLQALSLDTATEDDWRREMHRQHASARTVGAMAYAGMVRMLERDAREVREEGVPRQALSAWINPLEKALQQVEQAWRAMELRPPKVALTTPRQEAVATGLSASVLVVDDDPVVLLQMEQMLGGLGVAEVLLAHSGAEAIHLMGQRHHPVEVVVCDLSMPEMDGVEMIRQFGQMGFGGGLILMSGGNEQLLASVGRLAGMQGLAVLGHVQKPVTPGTMRVLLRKGSSTPVATVSVHKGLPITLDALRAAKAAQEFTVWFQPKVHAVSLVPVGVEALARWRRPDGTHVPPELFIAVAEETGLVGELSNVLLRAALREGARLHAAGYPLLVSVNLSALWLDDLGLPDLLLRTVLDVGMRPADVMLEVTETGLTKDLTTTLDVLSRLRLKGFGLSIDDFGIGYSSFEQLGRIPFTEMKLDRSFVNRAVRDAASLAILESSMAMAHRLELSTVAEGVETERELQLMRTLGCDSIQGYLIARPMPTDQLLRWLRDRMPRGGGAPDA
jgi:PAS domain S-box-containing protein